MRTSDKISGMKLCCIHTPSIIKAFAHAHMFHYGGMRGPLLNRLVCPICDKEYNAYRIEDHHSGQYCAVKLGNLLNGVMLNGGKATEGAVNYTGAKTRNVQNESAKKSKAKKEAKKQQRTL